MRTKILQFLGKMVQSSETLWNMESYAVLHWRSWRFCLFVFFYIITNICKKFGASEPFDAMSIPIPNIITFCKLKMFCQRLQRLRITHVSLTVRWCTTKLSCPTIIFPRMPVVGEVLAKKMLPVQRSCGLNQRLLMVHSGTMRLCFYQTQFHHSIFDLLLPLQYLRFFTLTTGPRPDTFPPPCPIGSLQPASLDIPKEVLGTRTIAGSTHSAPHFHCAAGERAWSDGELPGALAALPGSSPLFPSSSFLSHRTVNGSGDVENGNLCKGECCCSSCRPHRVQTALQNERSPASHHLSRLVQIFMKRRHRRGRREEERGVRTLGWVEPVVLGHVVAEAATGRSTWRKRGKWQRFFSRNDNEEWLFPNFAVCLAICTNRLGAHTGLLFLNNWKKQSH